MSRIGMMFRRIFRLLGLSRFDGLLISPSAYVEDGAVVLKQAGRIVGNGRLEELLRHPKGCDEIVVSPSDWHAIREGRVS